MIAWKDEYLRTIDAVLLFLQGKNATLAHQITKRGFLPEADRFKQVEEMDYAFGSMGLQDKAKHYATMYLEDLSDLIKDTVDPNFGFSRYAEHLGRSANSFDEMYEMLQGPHSFVDDILLKILQQQLEEAQPLLVGISVPFPGNLYAAFRCAQHIRAYWPDVKVAMGGGFANTELRSLSDVRVFEFFHFITLDDGETPIENLIKYVSGSLPVQELKRTFLLQDGKVEFINNPACADYKQGQIGTPDYSNLKLDKYISAIEVVNPMHSMWSDGRWNKLTMAHGCYWGKCTFCDTSLDYIARYEPLTAMMLADRMEEMVAATGESGFHFVDEAAPPALMRALALEIIKRQLTLTWWANIRFEKSFTRDLCLLLKASGCVAVSGGLEVASDRLLASIKKGITVSQVAKVNKHFTEAGIMVHAYLMYGFPTQTAQETIDSLEMVRQMFSMGIMQSAYWHLFSMTAHSPIGLNPEAFKVKRLTTAVGTFANNDLDHEDLVGTAHEQFGHGLRKSLYNFMQGNCLEDPLHNWFDFKVPRTGIASNFMEQCLTEEVYEPARENAKVIWLGPSPSLEISTKSKKGNSWEIAAITFYGKRENLIIKVEPERGRWLAAVLKSLRPDADKVYSLAELRKSYEQAGLDDFELFWDNKPVNGLYKVGLLVL